MLEIGTGSGYLTALLASQGAQVTSVEIDPRLAAEARSRLARAGIADIELAVGDGARGYGSGTYDAIVLTGSTPILPDAFVAQLKPGGRVFAVVGDAPVMTARITRWVAPGSVTTAGPVRDRDRAAQECRCAVAVPVLIPQIGPAELFSWRNDATRTPPLLIDVREPWEFEYCRIDGSLSIPLGELATRLSELPQDKALVMVCHHGNRSWHAAAMLEHSGFGPVHNLRGGVEEWASAVEPAMRRY